MVLSLYFGVLYFRTYKRADYSFQEKRRIDRTVSYCQEMRDAPPNDVLSYNLKSVLKKSRTIMDEETECSAESRVLTIQWTLFSSNIIVEHRLTLGTARHCLETLEQNQCTVSSKDYITRPIRHWTDMSLCFICKFCWQHRPSQKHQWR